MRCRTENNHGRESSQSVTAQKLNFIAGSLRLISRAGFPIRAYVSSQLVFLGGLIYKFLINPIPSLPSIVPNYHISTRKLAFLAQMGGGEFAKLHRLSFVLQAYLLGYSMPSEHEISCVNENLKFCLKYAHLHFFDEFVDESFISLYSLS